MIRTDFAAVNALLFMRKDENPASPAVKAVIKSPDVPEKELVLQKSLVVKTNAVALKVIQSPSENVTFTLKEDEGKFTLTVVFPDMTHSLELDADDLEGNQVWKGLLEGEKNTITLQMDSEEIFGVKALVEIPLEPGQANLWNFFKASICLGDWEAEDLALDIRQKYLDLKNNYSIFEARKFLKLVIDFAERTKNQIVCDLRDQLLSEEAASMGYSIWQDDWEAFLKTLQNVKMKKIFPWTSDERIAKLDERNFCRSLNGVYTLVNAKILSIANWAEILKKNKKHLSFDNLSPYNSKVSSSITGKIDLKYGLDTELPHKLFVPSKRIISKF